MSRSGEEGGQGSLLGGLAICWGPLKAAAKQDDLTANELKHTTAPHATKRVYYAGAAAHLHLLQREASLVALVVLGEDLLKLHVGAQQHTTN